MVRRIIIGNADSSFGLAFFRFYETKEVHKKIALVDLVVVVAVLFGLFVVVYSKLKDNSLKETIDEVKEIVNPMEIEYG